MADDTKQTEAFDEFTDAFTITLTPFGANISFAVREAHPSPGKPQQII
ncbi:unnamed protein product [marine sediment metagenome]|uniref:Uncharacterized protein n=1 Tax=marine sediment metagenome TaxID=412755 RepID=X1NR83_9ZZZZ